MPGPEDNINQNIEVNSEGKIYPWEIEGMDFSLYKSLDGYGLQMNDASRLIGREKEEEELQSDMTYGMSADNDSFSKEDAKKVVGGETGQIVLYGESAGNYYTSEQIPDAIDLYKEIRDIQKDISKQLRSRHKGKDDAESRYYQSRANEYADMLDLDSEVADPERGGNLFQAFFNAPYTSRFRAIAGGFPKFGTDGFEECIDIMDQKGVPGEKSIYDDYMTMMTAYSRELNVQYHRQQMEKEGWDAGKEKTYLNELRLEHQKSIEAFDKLWEIDDHGQYDKALNNPLDALVGKSASNHRDANDAVGYLRGEVRAIDLGYDSSHLHILGQVGMQEQSLKKRESELSIDHKNAEKELEDFKKDPEAYRNRNKDNKDVTLESLQEKLKGIEDKQEQLKEYKEEFGRFKDEIWGKTVNSKEEMQSAENRVNDFFSSHREKYRELQTCQDTYKQGIDYNKEKAAKAPEISGPSLHSGDINAFMQINDIMTSYLGGEDNFPGMQEKLLTSVGSVGRNITDKIVGAKKDKELNPGFDKDCKQLAGEVSDAITKNENERIKDKDHPAVERLRSGFAETAKIMADSMREGVHINEVTERGFFGVQTLIPQMDQDMFKPENADKLEKALKDYPLDRFVELGNKLQRGRLDYIKKEGGMSQKEKDAYNMEMNTMREEMTELSKELHEKSLNPGPETLSLFGKPAYLTAEATGFIGKRGLETIIKDYGKDFSVTDISDKQMDRLSSALDKVSAKRMGLFDSVGDERRFMREQAEKMQENLKKLKSGMIDSPAGPRPMTQNEKKDLLSETMDGLNDLSTRADTYIAHATKNGTKTPSGAGKTRLEGARDLKDLTNELQESLTKELQSQMKREASLVQKKAGDRKSISLKELQEKDKKTEPEHKGRNSVREPHKRPAFESAKHGMNDSLQNNKAVVPKRK